MKFGEIFWVEVKIDALEGGGVQAKRKRFYCQIVKATSDFTYEK